MANSYIPGRFNPLGTWTAARTPGMLGLNDQGDPNRTTLLGNTPGPLGLNDWADPNLPRYGAGNPFARFVRNDQGVAIALAANGSMPEMNDSLERLITREQLKQIFESASVDSMNLVMAELNSDLVRFCLNTVLRRAHFFAQVREEIGPRLVSQDEDMTYSPSGLIKTYKYYQINPAESIIDGYIRDDRSRKYIKESNEEAIANKVYAGKNGNGEAPSGDGWRYRGRGFIQITGRGIYGQISYFYPTLYGSSVNFVDSPHLLSVFPYSVRSAVCYWTMKNLHKLADQGSNPGNVNKVTEAINFYSKSYENRRKNFIGTFDAFK